MNGMLAGYCSESCCKCYHKAIECSAARPLIQHGASGAASSSAGILKRSLSGAEHSIERTETPSCARTTATRLQGRSATYRPHRPAAAWAAPLPLRPSGGATRGQPQQPVLSYLLPARS